MKFVYVKDIRDAIRGLKEHLRGGNWNKSYYYGLLEQAGWVHAEWLPFNPCVSSFLCFIEAGDEKALNRFLRTPLNELVKEAIIEFTIRGYGIEIGKDALSNWFEQYKKGIDIEGWDERELTGRDMVEMLKPIDRRIENYIKKYAKREDEVCEGDLALAKETGHCNACLIYEIYFFDKKRRKTLERLIEEYTIRASKDPDCCLYCKTPSFSRWSIYRVNGGVLEQAKELQISLTELLRNIYSC